VSAVRERDSDEETGVGGEDESIPGAQEQARKVYSSLVENVENAAKPSAISTVLSAALSLVSPALSIALSSSSACSVDPKSLMNSAPAQYMTRAEGAGIAAECASAGASLSLLSPLSLFGSGAGEEKQDVNMGASASAPASEGGTGAGAGAGKQGGHVTASGRVISAERWRALFGSDTSSSDGDSDGNDGCIVGDGCGAGGSGDDAEVQLLNPFGNDGPPLVAKGDFNEEAKKVVVYSTLDCCICMCISIVILLVCLPRLSARRGREGLRSEA